MTSELVLIGWCIPMHCGSRRGLVRRASCSMGRIMPIAKIFDIEVNEPPCCSGSWDLAVHSLMHTHTHTRAKTSRCSSRADAPPQSSPPFSGSEGGVWGVWGGDSFDSYMVTRASLLLFCVLRPRTSSLAISGCAGSSLLSFYLH